MVTVTFRHADGRETRGQGTPGQSLMQLAVQSGVTEILAECGGALACGTCHCHVAQDWFARLPPPSDMEAAMIDCVEAPGPLSRLSCQITLDAALDGLVIDLPAAQF